MNYSFHEASCYGNLWVKVIWKDGLFLLIKAFGQNLCKSFNLYFLCSFKGLGTMTLICLPFIAQVASGINFLRFVIRMGGGAEACGHSVAGKLASLSEIARCSCPTMMEKIGLATPTSVSGQQMQVFSKFSPDQALPTPLALSCLVLRCELEAYSAQQRDCEMLQSKDLGLVVIYAFVLLSLKAWLFLRWNSFGQLEKTNSRSVWNSKRATFTAFAIGLRQWPIAVSVSQQPAGAVLGLLR